VSRDEVAAKAQHSWVDRVIGRHDWVIQPSSYYYFRAGGTAVFEYECRCGALKESVWPGEHAAGRRLTVEEKKALGPYL